jgi:hypothetical protein
MDNGLKHLLFKIHLLLILEICLNYGLMAIIEQLLIESEIKLARIEFLCHFFLTLTGIKLLKELTLLCYLPFKVLISLLMAKIQLRLDGMGSLFSSFLKTKLMASICLLNLKKFSRILLKLNETKIISKIFSVSFFLSYYYLFILNLCKHKF